MNYWMDSKSRAWRSLEVQFIQEKNKKKSFSLLLLFVSGCFSSSSSSFIFSSRLPFPLCCCEVAASPPVSGSFCVRFFPPSCSGSPCGCGLWRSSCSPAARCCRERQQPPLYTPPPYSFTLCSLPPPLPRSCFCASSLSVWLMLKPSAFYVPRIA